MSYRNKLWTVMNYIDQTFITLRINTGIRLTTYDEIRILQILAQMRIDQLNLSIEERIFRL